jgi:selenide,water dikinase
MPARPPTDVVLIGGGHAHVQVLHRWITEPPVRTRLTLVVDRARAVYSGMVPGFAAGDYALHELEIDAARLARRAGAHVLLARAVALDSAARRITVEHGPDVRYDVASLDVGAIVRGLDLPGVRAHALATRPIRDWVDRLDARVAAAIDRSRGRLQIVVVGGGAAGVELGFTLPPRVRTCGLEPHVMVLSDADEILPGDSPRAARRLRREAERRGIAIRTGARVIAVEPDGVRLDHERVPADLVVWATGAAPWPWLAASSLPTDDAGFVRVQPTLEVMGRDDLFAVGDCATIERAPWVRKAGVYAVREGPMLDANLRARLAGKPLHEYRPQRRILSLIHLGDRRALASKWGLVAVGRWVWRWKRMLDRRFVRRYRAS